MKRSDVFLACLLAVAAFLFYSTAWGWDDEVTHKDLTDFAAYNSVLGPKEDYLKSIGFSEGLDQILPGSIQEFPWPSMVCDDKTQKTSCTARDWLKFGAEKEDDGSFIPLLEPRLRYKNHFHDPLQSPGEEGLDTLLLSGESALLWAQDSQAQRQEQLQDDQSWPTLRQLYYDALTQTDDTIRKQTFAQLFKGLGHQMHLLQDMAVPYHVRNDSHPMDAMQGTPLYNPEHWLARSHPLFLRIGPNNTF